MTPLIGAPSIWTLVIILALALLLFGGSRLAGLGKSAGKAIREFKDETKGIPAQGSEPTVTPPQPTTDTTNEPVEAELVDPPKNSDR